MADLLPEDYLGMQTAIDEALHAFAAEEVPVGAALFMDGRLIASGHNRKEQLGCATAHAEILTINRACEIIGDWRLENAVLYVTAEPCFMCAGAIIQSRISRVVFGVPEPKFGGIITHARLFDLEGLNHKVTYQGGIREEEIREIMKKFFRSLRSRSKEN